MSDKMHNDSAQRQSLRLKLAGKPLIGFDTTQWASNDWMRQTVSRIGAKIGMRQTAARIGAKGGTTPPPVAPR